MKKGALVTSGALVSREDDTQESVPELIKRAGIGSLSPEWIELAPIFDNHVKEFGGKSAIDATSGLVELAVATTEIANDFRDFNPRYLKLKDFNQFASKLDTHLLYYRSLGGIHGIEGRLDSFLTLEKGLERYVTHFEDEDPKSRSKYKRSYKRLWASVLEEIGEHTGDTERLKKALALNEEVVADGSISNLKRYKLHALMAKYDIADKLSDDFITLESLGLPTDPKERLARSYDDLAKFSEAAATEVRGRKHASRQISTEIAGAISEATYINYLRNEMFVQGLADRIVIRQSYPHQDSTEIPGHVFEKLDFHIPRSSFDVLIIDKETGETLRLDIKKGKRPGRRIMLIQTLRVRVRNNAATGLKYLKKVENMSHGRAKQLRGDTASTDELDAIKDIHEYMDYDEVLDRHRRRVGRAAVQAA